MSIDKLIASNNQKFSVWKEQLQEHDDAQYNRIDLSTEEMERVFFQTNELLIDIANNFFSYGKFKDNWDTSKCYLNVFGQCLLLKSEKMNQIFYWGVEKNTFYLESHIMYAEHLRHMTDEFWVMLLELKGLGDFEFSAMGSLSVEERPFFENKTSTIFQIIRGFMLYQFEKMNGSDYQQPPSMELGQLKLTWDFNTPWAILLEQTCKAFKLLYHINYSLWKIEDLAKKKSLKNKY
uniref:hypothetical protein n=1 Tax=Pedobacter schmidteae TaxID=2201271 RepID=UPI000EB25BAC|nr:hypothetical protein [Pedobacter schmidteae]